MKVSELTGEWIEMWRDLLAFLWPPYGYRRGWKMIAEMERRHPWPVPSVWSRKLADHAASGKLAR